MVLRHDERDRPDANIQYMFVMRYGLYYLGFLTMHDERGHFEQQLAFSRDGLTWSRPWRGNFLGLGPEGAFDSGMAGGITDPIATDSQLLFYYGGFTLEHYKPMSEPWSAAIGRATLRRDGFASWDSDTDQIAVVTTQPFHAPSGVLLVNADAEGGRLSAAILDEQGHPVEGYGESDSLSLTENSTRRKECMSPLRWREHEDMRGLAGRVIRLRFTFRNARLFAFRIGEACSDHSIL